MRGKAFRLRFALLGLTLLCGLALPAAAHFLLNVNIRIIHVEHLDDGLRVYLRLPAPYVLASLTGAPRADGTAEPAPYTTNKLVEGELMHYLDGAALEDDPDSLGRLVAEGHRFTAEGEALKPEVEQVRVYPALSQPPFSTLEEAERSFQISLLSFGQEEIFVGDAVIDVALRFQAGRPVYDYQVGSTLDPGLEGQDKTANLIIDHFSGEPLIFRESGLLATPVAVSRSAFRAALGFVAEGIRHILEGTDHVLFVICIAIGAASLGNLLWRVTGFTLGHTVTLILGFFGIVPQGAWFVPAVELAIALSIVYAAVIAVLQRAKKGTVAVTTAIGLVHGLGFSFVLHEILKLNSPNLWQSLISFNIGVEIGQLGIVVLVWPLFWYLAKRGDKPVQVARWTVALPCMAFAAIWAGERFRLLLPTL